MINKEEKENDFVKSLFKGFSNDYSPSNNYTTKVMSEVHHFEFLKKRKIYLTEQLTLGLGGLIMLIVGLIMIWKTGWAATGFQWLQQYFQPVLEIVSVNTIRIVLLVFAIQAILIRGLLGFFLFNKNQQMKNKFVFSKTIK